MRSYLILLGAGLAACGGSTAVVVPPGGPALLGDAWFEHRAAQLGLEVAAARARDLALPVDAPPEGLKDDAALAQEGAVLWGAMCAVCHGLQGDPPEQPAPVPRSWGTFGTSMGFFFGRDGMRAGLYRRIERGGEPRGDVPTRMPAWGSILSREQIWLLVRHLESL